MLALWSVLVPILAADIVNPVLFAFMVYAVGSKRPVANSLAVLLGHTFSYLFFGIGLAFVFDALAHRLLNPEPVDFGIGLLVGLLLLWVAWKSRGGGTGKSSQPQAGPLTPPKAFGIGAVINLVGLPFALPYFAALDQILKADLSISESVLVLIGYNVAYALPFLIVPVLALVMGEGARPVLTRLNEKVDRAGAVIMPLVLGGVGIALVIDAMLYFTTGKGLF